MVFQFNSSKYWKIQARYSILSELNENVIKYLKKYKNIDVQVPTFPAKKWWAVQDETFLNQRKDKLQKYLQELLQQPEALKIQPIAQFLCGREMIEETENGMTMNELLNKLRTQHHHKQQSQSNPKINTSSNYTAQAMHESSYEIERQSVENEISFPFSFCEVSMGQRNQQIYLGSFTEDIQSIKRKSIDQSDFDTNSSIMLFFPSPSNSRPMAPLMQNRLSNGRQEESLLRSSLHQVDMSKSNRSSQYQPNQNLNETDSIDNLINIISHPKNKNQLSNAYSSNLEEFKATQRNFKLEVEQIIESSEISSGIEQNLFVDSDDNDDTDDDNDMSQKNSSSIKQPRNNSSQTQNSNSNQQQSQLKSRQQNHKSQCRCYYSGSDSDDQSDSNSSKSSMTQNSYTKSLQQSHSQSVHATPIMQRSTDDDCANRKKRLYRSKAATQSQKKEYNYNTENILQFLQNNSCLSFDDQISPIDKINGNNVDNLIENNATYNNNNNNNNNLSNQNDDSTKTIYNNQLNDNDQDEINASYILKDLSIHSNTQRSSTVYMQNQPIMNSHNNNNLNEILI